jgi:hypothetical protein
MSKQISPSAPQPTKAPQLNPDTAWKLWHLLNELSTELWDAFDREFCDRVLREMEQEERTRDGPSDMEIP